jgi:hypothetical protein
MRTASLLREWPGDCIDCGADTAPCTGKRGCRHAGRWEQYMVHDSVWPAAGLPLQPDIIEVHMYLCIGCLERRLGRRLMPKDFTDCPLNRGDHPWRTPRLRARLSGI